MFGRTLDPIRWPLANLIGWSKWRTVSSMDDMGALVIRWLDGKDRFLPWHAGPPDEETAEISEYLRVLNRHGVVTTNSQPGVPLGIHGWQQRAWVHLLASPETARALVSAADEAGLIGICAGLRALPAQRIPITMRPGGRVNSSTTGAHEELFLVGGSRNLVESAWDVALIDPVWGRKDYLWSVATDCIIRSSSS